MSKYNSPVARLGKIVLVAQASDLPKIGTDQALEVMAEQWNLETGQNEGEHQLEQLLKFNPFEDLTEPQEIEEILTQLNKLRASGEPNKELKIKLF